MREFRADLHIHTCLSPCAEPEMVPTAIVERAKALGLDMIAICDHNSAENVAAVAAAGRRASVCVVPGIEITSREEVHVLGLFPTEQRLSAIQALVHENLPGQNDPEATGPQTVVDAWDRPLGQDPRLLLGATRLSLENVVEAIHRHGGLAVAAHVDRPSFGLIGQLGLVPEGLALDALELSPLAVTGRGDSPIFADFAAKIGTVPVVTSSDAHCLKDVGRSFTCFLAEREGAVEIGRALRREGGRRVSTRMQDLSLHLLDVVENSLAASASRIRIVIAQDTGGDRLSLEVADNGRGMDAETVAKVLDPFYTTRSTRRVGLGLPLLAQAARESGGAIEVTSQPGRGTTVRATFRPSHPDCKPLGDVVETLRTILAGRPELDLEFKYIRDEQVLAELHGSSEDEGEGHHKESKHGTSDD